MDVILQTRFSNAFSWHYSSIGSDNCLARPGDKPSSKPMIISLLMHICITRPQWVKSFLQKTVTLLCYTTNTIADDDPIPCVARSSAAVIMTVCTLTQISRKFVPTGQINNIPALVQIMAWRRPGDKPLSKPMNHDVQFTDVYMCHSASMS